MYHKYSMHSLSCIHEHFEILLQRFLYDRDVATYKTPICKTNRAKLELGVCCADCK